MAIQFHQLSRADQARARRLRDRAHKVGVLESVSQMAKDLHYWEEQVADAERAAAQPAQPSEAELLAERERLLTRIAEIDAHLPEPEGVEVTTRQAAIALGVSVRTVQRWASTGKVAAVKNQDGRWVVTIEQGGN
jgi:hypothetical protein